MFHVSTNQILAKIKRLNECARNLRALEKAAMEAATSGTASATISAGGGSKSYTRLSPSQIQELIGYWKREYSYAKAAITGRSALIKSVMVVRS